MGLQNWIMKYFLKLYYEKIYYTYKSNYPAKFDYLSLPTLPQSLAIIEANKKTSKVKSKLIIFLQIGLLTNPCLQWEFVFDGTCFLHRLG